MPSTPDFDPEPSRLRALQHYEILGSPPEAVFDDLAELASQICGTPIGMVSLVDSDRQWFKARRGISLSETPRSEAFCAHTIQNDGVLEVQDAREDSRFRDSMLVKGPPGMRFYAGAPLKTPEGARIGAICVMDSEPRSLSSAQKDALSRLARQTIAQMELRLWHMSVIKGLGGHTAPFSADMERMPNCDEAGKCGSEGRERCGLHRIESELAKFFVLAVDLLCVSTTDGYFTRVNPSFTRVLGWSSEELVSRPYLEFVHPEDRQSTLEATENQLQKGQPILNFENRYLCKDGGVKILSWKAMPHPDGMVYATARDVTEERGLAELKVRMGAQTERFQQTLLTLRDHEGEELYPFLGVVTSAVAQALQVERVSIWFFEDADQAIACQSLHSLSKGAQPPGVKLKAEEYPSYFEAAKRRHPIVADDAHTHRATREFSAGYLTPLGISSMLDVPILQDGRLRGIICHENVGPIRHWTPEEVKFALSVAACVTISLEQQERRMAEKALRELNTTLEQRVLDRTAALQESEARFRQIAEGIDSIFWMTGKSLEEVTYVSPAYEKILGRSVESLMSQPLSWMDAIHPEDRERAVRTVQEGYRLDRDAFEVEFRIVRHADEIRHVRLRGFAVRSEGGKLLRRVGLADDITQHVIAEREIRQALATLDATEDGAFIFDPDSLRFTYVNQGAMKQLGLEREELLGRTLLDFASDLSESDLRKILGRMLRGEVFSHRLTTSLRGKNQEEVPVEINLQHIVPDGEKARCIAIVRDITERRRMELQASRSQRLEAIGTLAGGVAHDLNNALAPIMIGVESLRRKCPAEKPMLDIFENSAMRASGMVRQLVTFAKGAEGKRIAIQPLHLMEEIKQIIKGTFPKNIRLKVECEAGLPAILGDATQLHQILLNLCVNGRDAMPNGGTLSLSARTMDMDEVYASSIPEARAGRYVYLEVQDTGTGIAPAVLERIFDPFFTTKGPDKGTGLGLSTVMGIVKGHGGFVQVYSQVGSGSRFSVYLPVDNETEAATPKRALPEEFRGRGETILLVDDEETFREVGSRVLSEMNFKVITAMDGTDGLMKVAERKTELRAIITDQHMPHMDGLTFVRALRHVLPEVPVAVGSGRLDDGIQEQYQSLGVTLRLDKPYTQEMLVNVMKKMLSTPEAHAA